MEKYGVRKSLIINQKGMLMVFTLMILLLMSLWGVATLTLIINEYHINNSSKKGMQAYYLAEAGLEDTLAKLKNNVEEIENTKSVVTGDIDVSIVNDFKEGDTRIITFKSVGKVDNCKKTLFGKVNIISIIGNDVQYLLLKNYSLKTGEVIKNNVYCEGNLILNSGAQIIGNVYCEDYLILDPQSNISGDVHLKNENRLKGSEDQIRGIINYNWPGKFTKVKLIYWGDCLEN